MYVRIIIRDGDLVLEHWFVRNEKWGLPAGAIEPGEAPVEAARRELLERTGYAVEDLTHEGTEGEFEIFSSTKDKLTKVAKPGEKGGYTTKIRWNHA